MKVLRPFVWWEFTDQEAPLRLLASLGDKRIVHLYDEDEEGPFALTPPEAVALVREWKEAGEDSFRVHDPDNRWNLHVSWDDNTFHVSGILASWRPESDDVRLSGIGRRGKGPLERIPPGLPAEAYDGLHEDSGRVAAILRADPKTRLGYFKARVHDEVWVEGDRVAATYHYLGPEARPLGGLEFRAWVREAPDALVDVQPGNQGENLLPRREVLTMIWESIFQT